MKMAPRRGLKFAASLCSLLVIVSAGLAGICAAQERAKGVSIHMLPRRVAELGGWRWGLSVDLAPRIKAGAGPATFQSSGELLSFFRTQDAEVQSNGIWIVITNPSAYSEEELALLEEVKAMSRREKIPLFVCRASALPNGWQRFDQ